MPPSPGGREELGPGGRRPLAPGGRGGADEWGPRPWEARGLQVGPEQQRVQKQEHQVSTAAESAGDGEESRGPGLRARGRVAQGAGNAGRSGPWMAAVSGH